MTTLLSPPGQYIANVHSYEAFVAYARSIPILNPSEERQLMQEYKLRDNLEAAKALILSHLRFVVHIAKSFKGYGLPMEDIVQEGNIGLMKSIKKFDLTFDVRLASFAAHWIKAEINEYVIKNWRMVKVATTKARKKLFFGLRKFKQSHSWLSDEEVKLIADELGVDKDDVRDVEASLVGKEMRFSPSFDDSSESESDSPVAWSALLEDFSQSPEHQYETTLTAHLNRERLSAALQSLDERSRDIIESRWLVDKEHQVNLADLGKKYGVSAERIRQSEANALKKLKEAMINRP